MGSESPNPSVALVERLMAKDSRIRRVGLRAAMRALMPADRPDLTEMMAGFLPDGYLILPEARELHLIEVIDTSPISFDKAELLYQFGEAIDERMWSVAVVAYDYSGHLIGHLYYRAFHAGMMARKRGLNPRDALPAALAVQREVQWLPSPGAGVVFESI